MHWTRLAYNSDASESFGNYRGLRPGFSGPLPEAPSDGVPGSNGYRARRAEADAGVFSGVTREELRRMIAEELRAVLRK